MDNGEWESLLEWARKFILMENSRLAIGIRANLLMDVSFFFVNTKKYLEPPAGLLES